MFKINIYPEVLQKINKTGSPAKVFLEGQNTHAFARSPPEDFAEIVAKAFRIIASIIYSSPGAQRLHDNVEYHSMESYFSGRYQTL